MTLAVHILWKVIVQCHSFELLQDFPCQSGLLELHRILDLQQFSGSHTDAGSLLVLSQEVFATLFIGTREYDH